MPPLFLSVYHFQPFISVSFASHWKTLNQFPPHRPPETLNTASFWYFFSLWCKTVKENLKFSSMTFCLPVTVNWSDCPGEYKWSCLLHTGMMTQMSKYVVLSSVLWGCFSLCLKTFKRWFDELLFSVGISCLDLNKVWSTSFQIQVQDYIF